MSNISTYVLLSTYMMDRCLVQTNSIANALTNTKQTQQNMNIVHIFAVRCAAYVKQGVSSGDTACSVLYLHNKSNRTL